ncbi:RGCVC family protein [Actinophytocola algeriensis]|uniref:RGCVC family protein n=1 Tax=Actinophytocola algeriensis TaxID=1768010 RepID=UPI001C8757D6|nr:RGCVC family protein [Actinophytocola algeriensis]
MAPSPAHGETSGARRCAACGHDWRTHDDIAARYCAATSVSRASRGCVCAPDATNGDGGAAG